MGRHWLGVVWFGCFAALACVLTLLLNENGLAVSALVVATVAFTVYVIGESGLGEPSRDRDGKA